VCLRRDEGGGATTSDHASQNIALVFLTT
jgi:hypothetical protein